MSLEQTIHQVCGDCKNIQTSQAANQITLNNTQEQSNPAVNSQHEEIKNQEQEPSNIPHAKEELVEDDDDVLNDLIGAKAGEIEQDMQYMQITATVERIVDVNEMHAKVEWGQSKLKQLPKYVPQHYLQMNENAFTKKDKNQAEVQTGLVRSSSQLSVGQTPFKHLGRDDGQTYDQSYNGSQINFGDDNEGDLKFSNEISREQSQSDIFGFDIQK